MKIIAFKRIDDGELFTLNDDGITYSLKFMKDEFPDSLHMMYFPQNFQQDYFLPVYEKEKI